MSISLNALYGNDGVPGILVEQEKANKGRMIFYIQDRNKQP